MKKLLYSLVFLGLFTTARSQVKTYDTTAIVILDHMSAIIGNLTSCRFRLNIETDVTDPEFGTLTSHEINTVWISGPGKMLIDAIGNKGHRGFWYNGQTLTWYSFTENNYVIIPVPDNLIRMIDSVNDTYGIDFPAADFLNPSLSDDLIGISDNISYQGKDRIYDQSCYQIVAKNKEMNIQLWIADDLMFLPVKMVITCSGKASAQRYECTFSDWQVNPDLPAALFEFAVPPGASQVSILSRK